MDDQKAVFMHGEGDAYFRRNAEKNSRNHAAALADPRHDPVIRNLVDLKPKRILEIGASNGWRLDAARLLWGADGFGLDPSAAARSDGMARYPKLTLGIGTADRLPDMQFDCVVFGFCLYLCDRNDLFQIATEANRALVPGGYLVVYDFFPPAPFNNPYVHQAGVYSYKMDYAKLWSWHPAYTLWRHEVFALEDKSPDDPNERIAVSVLKKIW